ncbi:hypothetical protein ACN27E_23740 [Mycobacterium sp. WMMD1722]|uniref:hypothetical protein n=1 Tax=Mycobacterium sp. WMMD1722 TaxID=3404117 RepID=UPI003BF514B1
MTEVSTPEQGPGDPPAAPSQQRVWSMPKNPVTRDHVDKAGRAAAKTAAAIGGAAASSARMGGRAVSQSVRALGRVPVALRLLLGFGILTLLGVAGSIALSGPVGLLCAVVVVPVCAGAAGALGHRWYNGAGGAPVQSGADTVDDRELARSVAYVDRKLTVALNTLGSERHQQAVIALFQAKTAVELALGTEGDDAGYGDAAIPVDAQRIRPRIQAGSTSLAAS